MLLTDMVKHLGISVSGVGYAVERGEAIERDKNCHLGESRGCPLDYWFTVVFVGKIWGIVDYVGK